MRSLSPESKEALATRAIKSNAVREALLRSCAISQVEVESLTGDSGFVPMLRREDLGWLGTSEPFVAPHAATSAVSPVQEKNLRAKAVYKDLKDLLRIGAGKLRLDLEYLTCSIYDKNEREWLYLKDGKFHGVNLAWVNCKEGKFNDATFGFITYLFDVGLSRYLIADPAVRRLALTVLDGKDEVFALTLFSQSATQEKFSGLLQFVDRLGSVRLESIRNRVTYLQRSYQNGYYPGVNIENLIRRSAPRPPIPLDEF
ncbi:MAG: hypothetical protein LVQ95_00750 [Candidatus Micrarchaeales archaeon]|nr:hypothetical protein [Candidatus Micrarchaeales archaeon]